jgi:hypothetical protein
MATVRRIASPSSPALAAAVEDFLDGVSLTLHEFVSN